MKKIIRITTIAASLKTLLRGQLRFMSHYYEIIGISGSGITLDSVAAQEGIRTIPVSMTRSITPFRDIIGVWQLYNIFKKERPFVVHTHTPKAGTLGMMAAKLAGVPHRLHTIAGLPLLEATGPKRKILDFVEKLTYANATLVLPNSYALKNIIIEENYCPPNKLRVIANGSSNGIDIDHYNKDNVSEKSINKLKKQLNISSEDVVFIFIGRIVRDKGINELVEAFQSISEMHSNAKLIVVGFKEKSLDPISSRTEFIMSNNDNIHETGNIQDIRPYLAISQVLTLPSYREGFPNVVLQASCMGLPCIVSDINGCNEIITNGFNGLIVPAKDSMALKKAMLHLFHHPDKIHELAKNCRPNIIEKYKKELVWQELLDLYDTLDS